MSVTRIFVDILNTKLLNCKDIIKYTSWDQIAFDKIFSLLNDNLWISKKIIKMTLQSSLLQYLGKNYLALVSAIETIDLQDIILRVIWHAEINKDNNQDIVVSASSSINALVVNIQQLYASQRTCTTQECID